jgi:polyphosphate glucokinase
MDSLSQRPSARPATKSKLRSERPLARAKRPKRSPNQGPRTLALDIGGTGIKMIVLDEKGRPVNARARELTPRPATPRAVLAVIGSMLESQPKFDRVSAGFPGVVIQGVTLGAVNLKSEQWRRHDLKGALEKLTKVPVRVINDADLQGYGVIQGRGVELVLTLGTGVGSALFVNGHLVPNLELGHHPFKKGETYEERLCDAEFKRLGKKHWSKRVREMIDQLAPIFNYDLLHIGGGNAEHIATGLPKNVRIFSNVDGMTGGIRLWADEA